MCVCVCVCVCLCVRVAVETAAHCCLCKRYQIPFTLRIFSVSWHDFSALLLKEQKTFSEVDRKKQFKKSCPDAVLSASDHSTSWLYNKTEVATDRGRLVAALQHCKTGQGRGC